MNKVIDRSSFQSNPWQDKYSDQDQNYELAYQVGHESHDRNHDQSFEEVESQLKSEYEALCGDRGQNALPWEQAKRAVRDAWDQAQTT